MIGSLIHFLRRVDDGTLLFGIGCSRLLVDSAADRPIRVSTESYANEPIASCPQSLQRCPGPD